MKNFFTLLILCLAVVGLKTRNGYAQYSEYPIMVANSIAAATPEFGPDGTATNDSAWIVNSATDQLSPISLIICADSVSGYGTADDSVTVEVLYTTLTGTVAAYPANYTTQVVFDRDMAIGSIPLDTCYTATWTPPPHGKRRYRVSVDDDISVTITEARRATVYSNPWRP